MDKPNYLAEPCGQMFFAVRTNDWKRAYVSWYSGAKPRI